MSEHHAEVTATPTVTNIVGHARDETEQAAFELAAVFLAECRTCGVEHQARQIDCRVPACVVPGVTWAAADGHIYAPRYRAQNPVELLRTGRAAVARVRRRS